MTTTFTQRNPRALGIFCLVGAIALLSVSDTIIKWLSPRYALHEIMLIRACVALSVTMLLVYWEGGLRILRTRRLGLHLLRGLLIAIANMCFFLGLATMAFADAVALFFVAPLFITALSQPLLGERVGPVRWFAVCAGLVGVLVMVRPGFGTVSFVALLPLAAALAYACMQMLTRRLGITDTAATLAFYIQTMFVIFSATMGLILGHGRFDDGASPTWSFLLRAWTWPTSTDFMLIGLCGCSVAFGGYLLSQAYRTTEAAVIAPFEYVGLPFAVFWGYQIWGDLPDRFTLMGSLLIVGSGLMVFYRETRRR